MKTQINQKQKQKQKQKVSQHLLHFAENDQFLEVLHLLLSPSSGPQVNFNARTKSGDYLVTLLAYATGELNLGSNDIGNGNDNGSVPQRLYALKCLQIVLERDFTAVNKVASDGGAALHCALAAASCDCDCDCDEKAFDEHEHEHGTDIDDDDSDDYHDEDDDGSEYSDSDSDDDDDKYSIDRKYIAEITAAAAAAAAATAEKDSTLQSYCQEYNSLSSEEIMLAAILLLLENGADPNIPLGNVYAIRSMGWNNGNGNGNGNGNNGNGNESGGEEDELELTFARESIIQQWTPLMFAAQWIIIACIKCVNEDTSSNHGHGHGNNNDNVKVHRNRRLALPIAILQLLLDFDADQSYMMAGQVVRDWNLVQVFASASHILHHISMDEIAFTDFMVNIRAKCVLALAIEDHRNKQTSDSLVIDIDGEKKEKRPLSDYMHDLIHKTDTDMTTLSSLEAFATAIMTNDAEKAQRIIDDECRSKNLLDTGRSELQREWSNTLLEETLPTIQTAWANSSLDGKTLLDIACSCSSTEVLEVMIGGGTHFLSEGQIRHGIISIFEDLGGRSISGQDQKNDSCNQALVNKQMSLISLLLQECRSGNDNDNDLDQLHCRQRMLDRLLLESCTGKQWTMYSPNATQVLLHLGADPNVKSIATEIHDAITPLHLVAGNCRGTEGIDKLRWLLLDEYTDHHQTADSSSIGTSQVGKFEKANLFAMTTSSHEMPIHIALRKQNYRVAEIILEAIGEKRVHVGFEWSLEDAIIIGQVAVDRANVALFKQALQTIVSSASTAESIDTTKIERAIGGLLLKVLDERSGFGKARPLSATVVNIQEVISAIEKVNDELNLTNLASWARDEISGQNLLHLIRFFAGSEKESFELLCFILFAS